jgi:hypothetical protein
MILVFCVHEKIKIIFYHEQGFARAAAPEVILPKSGFMLRLISILFLAIFLSATGSSQTAPSTRFSFGVEQDVLPYATGGYYAGFWAGKNKMRVRALLAHVHKPDFIIKKGFVNNRVTAYALVGDYFLKEGWKGWWASSGLVYWSSNIQTLERRTTQHYNNVLLNGSIGYNWRVYRNVYISPWAGMHLRVAGDRAVPVDGKVFTTALFNPEASVKVGWHFH